MNNILGIKKLDFSGFTSFDPLIKFVQENNEWNNPGRNKMPVGDR